MIARSKNQDIKSKLKIILVLMLVFISGLFAGKFEQHLSNGYHFEVREEKKYEFDFGEIRWRNVSETFGMPFLDPGTTLIEFNGRTLYKAKRSFQESVPFARNIQTSGNTIHWDDGEYRFNLTLEKMEGKTELPNAK